MSLSEAEVKHSARVLDQRWLEKSMQKKRYSDSMSVEEMAEFDALLRKKAREERNDRMRQRRRLKVVTGDALSPGAMKLARAYDAADPMQQRCMDAIAAVALVMQA